VNGANRPHVLAGLVRRCSLARRLYRRAGMLNAEAHELEERIAENVTQLLGQV
jgi:hypothetical protein